MPIDSAAVRERHARRHWAQLLPTLAREDHWPTDRAAPDRDRPASPITVHRRLDSALAARVRGATRGDGLLLHALVVAAVTACFAAARGHRAIVVGTPPRLGGDASPADILPVAVAVAPDLTRRAHLQAVREALIAAYDAQGVDPGPIDGPSTVDGPDGGRHQLVGWVIRNPDAHGGAARAGACDGTVEVRDSDAGPAIRVDADAGLFRVASIDHLADQVVMVIGQLLDDPDATLSDLVRLSATRRAEALRAATGAPPAPAGREGPWIASPRGGPEGGASALVGPDGRYGYDDLHATVEAMARGLLTLPVAGTVALTTGQTTATVAGALAALRAGRPYVVVPPDRIADERLLRERGVGVRVVGDGDGPAGRDTGAGPDGGPPIARRSVADLVTLGSRPDAPGLPDEVDPATPAYVVYTSGSTGVAKAIVVTRANLAASNAARHAVYGSAPQRFMLLSPLHFDSSVAGLYWTLGCGGTLHITPPGIVADPGALARFVHHHAITATLGLPRVLDGMFRAARADDLRTLRLVIGAGESFPAGLAARMRAVTPEARLVNEYGPSEATVWATSHEVTGAETEVPIGRPVPGGRVYVLDAWGGLVPPGVAGELAIGGPQVAAGYLDATPQDAARFSIDPFAAKESGARFATAGPARLYRTGDLGWAEPDGTLYFLGRRDDEVKIRDARVVLADVSTPFRDFPGVTEAETLLHDGQLAVFVAPIVDATALLDAVRPRLARHAVPARVVPLPAIPRRPTGKVDRHALVALLRARPTGHADGPPDRPADPLQRRLVDLFRTVLGNPTIGADDDFFGSGGDSIRAVLLVAELSRWLRGYVYVVALLDHPTPAALAAFLRTAYASELAAISADRDGPEATTDGAAGQGVDCGEPGQGATPHAAEVLRASVAEAAEPDVAPAGDAPAGAPVPRLVFVLGSPRSGTTLLRVILGGHPALFAPPELELLQYGTLARRRDALSGRHAFYREGLTRAVMALLDVDAAEADARLDQLANEGLSSAGMYAWLVERAGGRIVVDNTTTYALDAHALHRAELVADRPRYVHLTRHPQACVSSYLAARLDRMYLRVPHRFDAATQAELVWRTAHENVAAFLDTVAPERVLRLSYEELVTAPEAATRRLCDHLGVDFDARMLDIHDDRRARMTDGLRPGGIMLGDVKFHEHRGISTDSLARWREAPLRLHERTAAVARELGYAGDELVRDTPLTAAQRWMWLLEFLNPGSTMFTVPLALAGDGGLDLDAVHRAIRTLTRRHHALRSLVVVPVGEPVLRFVPDLAPVVVVEEVPAARHEARAAELAGAGFDLAAGSALRLHVLLDGDRFTLLFLVHHIVADAWSVRLLTRDFLAAYDAWHRGEAPDMPPLPRQPSDAAQEEATADATVAADAARRVRERLDGAIWALNLPPARAGDPPGGPQVLHVEHEIDAATSRAVRALAAARGASVYRLLLTAFGWTLHRWTGDRDLCIGTPVLTRGPLDGDVVGMFVNTAVVRLDASGPVTFDELLDRNGKAVRDAIADAAVPFEEIVMSAAEHAGPDGSLLRAAFSVQDLALPLDRHPALSLRPVPLPDPHRRFDVNVAVATDRPELTVGADLTTARFDMAMARRFVDDFVAVVTGAAAAPGAPLETVPRPAGVEPRTDDTYGEARR